MKRKDNERVGKRERVSKPSDRASENSSRSGGFGSDKPRFPSRGDSDSPRGSDRDNKPFKKFGERDERPKFDRGDKPFRKFDDRSDRPRGDRDEKPFKKFGERDERPKFDRGDKPFRKFDDRNDRPRGDRDEKPFRKFDDRDERPKFDRGEKPFRKFDDRNDRPRGDRDEKPFKKFGDRDERPKFKRGDKPFRKFDDRNDRPRGDRDEKPFKKFGDRDERPKFDRGEKPFRKFDDRNDRPRGDRDEKPFRKFDDRDERPKFDRGEKPFRKFDDRNNRPGRDRNDNFRDSQSRFGKKPFSGDDRRGGFRRDDDNNRFDNRTSDRPDFGDNHQEERTFRKFGNKDKRGKDDAFEYGKTLKPQKRPDYSEENLLQKIPAKQRAKVEDGLDSKSSDMIRLNRYIANAGLCSRREADDLIESGQITVNGKTITEMGYQVKTTDVVKYGRKILNREKMVYVLLNKPKDFITTTEDPEGRRTVMELVAKAGTERIYPVGRLDRATTGLLLFTNDGELAEKLSHPSNEIRKIYQVEIDKPISKEDFDKLMEGVELEDGFIKADEVSVITPDQQVIGIEIHSGKNRVVRRIFEALGYEVTKLDRTTYAGLTKKDLPRGNWRFLTEKEVIRLKYMI